MSKVTSNVINSYLIKVVLKSVIISNSQFHLGFGKCTSDFVFFSMKPSKHKQPQNLLHSFFSFISDNQCKTSQLMLVRQYRFEVLNFRSLD